MPDQKTRGPVHVTTGAGIAIAGAWLAGAAVTTVLFLATFVWNQHPGPATKAGTSGTDALAFIIVCLLIAAPMMAAYSITKVILGKKD